MSSIRGQIKQLRHRRELLNQEALKIKEEFEAWRDRVNSKIEERLKVDQERINVINTDIGTLLVDINNLVTKLVEEEEDPDTLAASPSNKTPALDEEDLGI